MMVVRRLGPVQQLDEFISRSRYRTGQHRLDRLRDFDLERKHLF